MVGCPTVDPRKQPKDCPWLAGFPLSFQYPILHFLFNSFYFHRSRKKLSGINSQARSMIIFLVLTCVILNGEGVFAGRNSPLLESFGCIDKTNVTVFYPNIGRSLSIVLKYLKDPCITIFIYLHHKREVVQWKGNQNEIEAEVSVHKSLSESEYLEFIQHLHQEQIKDGHDEGTTNQILLLVQAHLPMTNEISKAIESLDKHTKWNVIVACTHYCPIFKQFPINRIFPVLGLEIPMNLKSIVKNPNFNKNEYQASMELGKPSLPCLANKTIHVFNLYHPVELIVDIARIMHNTRNMNTKIILYVHTSFWSNADFWTYYIEKNGWKDIFDVVFQNKTKVLPPPPRLNTNEIYLISEIFLQPEVTGKLENENFCSRSDTGKLKTITFYKFNELPESTVNSTRWFDGLNESCKKNFGRVSFNTRYNTEENFNENFLEEILKASCF